jgi:hypothetical protein
MSEIKEQLDRLAEFKAQAEVVRLEKQKIIDAILTDEIKAQLASVDEEFSDQEEAVGQNIADLEAEIKDAVAMAGVSVKGQYLQAVYSKPRVSWDTKGLDGYAVAHPEVAAFKKSTGVPSVSIRVVK